MPFLVACGPEICGTAIPPGGNLRQDSSDKTQSESLDGATSIIAIEGPPTDNVGDELYLVVDDACLPS